MGMPPSLAANPCTAPEKTVIVRDGDGGVVVSAVHAGRKRPTSCETHQPLRDRVCSAELDLACASGPCRPFNDQKLAPIVDAFAAHLAVCLGQKPTVVIGDVKRSVLDLSRDAADRGGTQCALGEPAARPYWDAFYDAFDRAAEQARAHASGEQRALVIDVHTYGDSDVAPAPALILGAGHPFGATMPHKPVALFFDENSGVRARLYERFARSFAGFDVFPVSAGDVDEDLFAGRSVLAHAPIDALQLEVSGVLRDEPELTAYLAADAVCEALAPSLFVAR